MQVVHPVAKLATNASGAIWWPNLQPIQEVSLKSISNYSSWEIYSSYGLIRGISKSIRHFIRHFIRHLTVLSVTWPFYPSLDRFIRHLTISARMWISLIILIQFDHQNDYDQSSSSVRVVISTIEHPTYACNMSQRWPVLVGTQVFVIADIWICWFGRFVFVKPSLSHLQTSDKHINTCFGAVMDFSQNMFCIFRVLLSTFADIC